MSELKSISVTGFRLGRGEVRGVRIRPGLWIYPSEDDFLTYEEAVELRDWLNENYPKAEPPMTTRTEIIEAGARAVAGLEWGSSNGGVDPTDDQVAESALDAMLPLIQAQIAHPNKKNLNRQ